MSGKGKRRVVVPREGHARELLCILERKNGDLLVALKFAPQFEDDTEIVNQHYSVHLSPNSDPPGHLVKHTLKLADGREYTTSQFRYREPYVFRTLLYARVAPLLGDRYISRPRDGDTVLPLCDVDIGRGTLFYSVAVMSKDADSPAVVDLGLQDTRIEFTHFDIHIAFGFFGVPAIHKGHLQHFGTRAPRLDNVPFHPDPVVDLGSLTKNQLRECIAYFRVKLADIMLEQHLALVFNDGTRLREADIHRAIAGFERMSPMPYVDE